ncbi:hypothetical protein OM076_15160 [Solirubrobacter ginsenosidimutans]|uniref:Glycoside hydrolase family 3 N-terminal domain-containing protein n=1 Tax=Solirubrobacter ginsenosidimutans TaxID=490573 RepID=A0A9X3MUP1_9ACTN|nr:glycoside hydrolase family 3 N-terminal domain-containing protein [Solirubrobacter ginsenosidimutans]MDA0161615.1 hypothetical protein [Solirubrobacter ginsenosidimutans]
MSFKPAKAAAFSQPEGVCENRLHEHFSERFHIAVGSRREIDIASGRIHVGVSCRLSGHRRERSPLSGSGRVRRKAEGWCARAGLGLATLIMAALVALPSVAAAEVPPYSLPVTLPVPKQSPAVDANAPYTSVVLDLIHQLEPSSPPTRDQLANASKLLHDGANGACHNVGPVSAPTGTNPSIAPICWTDAQGVLNTSGPNTRGSTGPMTLMGLGSTFDRSLGNAWGQTEGTESRSFMVTGLFGPQTDLDRLPNWGRNLTTTGEDPYLSHEMVAAQINGIQGVGAMSQMKHFRRLQRPEPEPQHRHLRPAAARELPAPVRGRVRGRQGRGDDVLLPGVARHVDAPSRLGVGADAAESVPVRAGARDVAAERIALLVRAAADPQLRAA